MKITIKKENNEFYLEVKKPHYPINCGYNSTREVDKVYRAIERKIEKYSNKEDDLNLQYLNVIQMMSLLRGYFELYPDVLKIKIQYRRKYPSEWIWVEEEDSVDCSFLGETFTVDFIKENIKVLKTRKG